MPCTHTHTRTHSRSLASFYKYQRKKFVLFFVFCFCYDRYAQIFFHFSFRRREFRTHESDNYIAPLFAENEFFFFFAPLPPPHLLWRLYFFSFLSFFFFISYDLCEKTAVVSIVLHCVAFIAVAVDLWRYLVITGVGCCYNKSLCTVIE